MAQQEKEADSLMAQKVAETRDFLQARGQAPADVSSQTYNAFKKCYYLFYGILMDPRMVAHILSLDHKPILYPAKVVGFSCKLWGPYPVATNDPGKTLNGMAYEAQSKKDAERLQQYETDHYTPGDCTIVFEDDREVAGKVFQWNANESSLKEGTFNSKDWQKGHVDDDGDW